MRARITVSAFVSLLAIFLLHTNDLDRAQQSNYQDTSAHSISPLDVDIGATGRVGAPFRDPDSGQQIVRVTDSSTEPLIYGCCQGHDSAEAMEWGAYDSTLFSGDGGYRFHVLDTEGGQLLFEMNAQTMAIQQITHATNPHGLDLQNRANGWTPNAWSQSQPTVVYGFSTDITQMVKYDTNADSFYTSSGSASSTVVPYVDFSTCPNLPLITGNSGASYSARGDRYFSAILGGVGQEYYIAAWKDKTAGDCYWYDTYHGLYGGTGISGSPATTKGMLPTPGTPSISASQGGSVNVCAMVTGVTSLVIPGQTSSGEGETLPSKEICTTAGSGAKVTLTFASGYSNPWDLATPGCGNTFTDTPPCRPYNVYMDATGSGNDVLQTESASVSGPIYSITVSSIRTGTPHPPGVTTAGSNIHQGVSNLSGSLVELTIAANNTLFFWTPPNTVVLCPGATPDHNNTGCSGHAVGGYSFWINGNGFPGGTSNPYSISKRPFATPYDPPAWPSSIVSTTQIPSGIPSMDTHLSWNDDTPADMSPVGVVTYTSVAQGNGSLELNSNPCTAANQGWVNQILTYATNFSGAVSSLAYHRGGACPNPNASAASWSFVIPIGNISQDGKFILFHSTYGWGLGSEIAGVQNHFAYPASTWQPDHTYPSQTYIWDGANFEVNETGSSFTSGSTHPAWTRASGGSTADGTGVWTMNTGCTDAHNPGYGEACRTDVFIVATE